MELWWKPLYKCHAYFNECLLNGLILPLRLCSDPSLFIYTSRWAWVPILSTNLGIFFTSIFFFLKIIRKKPNAEKGAKNTMKWNQS